MVGLDSDEVIFEIFGRGSVVESKLIGLDFNRPQNFHAVFIPHLQIVQVSDVFSKIIESLKLTVIWSFLNQLFFENFATMNFDANKKLAFSQKSNFYKKWYFDKAYNIIRSATRNIIDLYYKRKTRWDY